MSLLDKYYTFKFINLLTQSWTDTDAYKLGIINDKGEVIRKGSTLKTPDEKNAYNMFNRLVWNIRKLLEKLPMGLASISKYALIFKLLKEETGVDLSEPFAQYLKEHHNQEIPKVSQFFIESRNHKYTKVFNIIFEDHDDFVVLPEDMTTTAGIDIVDKRLGEDDETSEKKSETFAGSTVFTCDPDTFHKSRLGKTKFARYKTFVGDDDTGQKIREYGNKNPKKNIILKNGQTGAMLYLRKH